MKYVATVNDESRVVEVTGADGRYRVALGDEVWEVDARLTAQGIYSLLIDGVSYVADVLDRDGACVVEVGGEWYEIGVEEQTRHIIRTGGGCPPAAGRRSQPPRAWGGAGGGRRGAGPRRTRGGRRRCGGRVWGGGRWSPSAVRRTATTSCSSTG